MISIPLSDNPHGLGGGVGIMECAPLKISGLNPSGSNFCGLAHKWTRCGRWDSSQIPSSLLLIMHNTKLS